ncbi:MAG: Gfo/Idh/MocA family oxidoreductase [Candidatus Hydrogenedentes bacterium]|nr:Gfo/Idh/MocA family oxidoreductase [Candidatus Hydrogenedentota bacterium]
MVDKTHGEVSRRNFIAGVGAVALAGAAAGESLKSSETKSAKPKKRAPIAKIRMGVVGGNFGAGFQWHLDPDCKVTAVCDIRDEALGRLAKTYGCANTFKTFREMLQHPELDAVGVFTPAPLHVWMAIEAMKAGKHVISAVPAGMSADELEELLDCVKSTGMTYMMAETSYYHPEIIACREKAQAGEFGTIFYSEAEYHHEGLKALMYDDRGLPTWRHGFPPMHYPTHCTGMIVPVTGERLTAVSAIGWGDDHEILRTNTYGNPFWNTTAFFRTARGHSARVAVYWHVAAGGTERASFYGDRMSYSAARPEGSPNSLVTIAKDGKTTLDTNGYPEGDVHIDPDKTPDYFDRLPEPMRVQTGHHNSHTFLTHEFVRAVIEDRPPSVDVYEAIAYTMPGIVAHQSAIQNGRTIRIRDYGVAPEREKAAKNKA